ncbi:fibroblast growth factor 22 isoform X1 [Zonotrichia leucophrys gambelii]|uniref:fibroblast growth factor 22 isoform X1 n=1 Tax=Zonotrichia leucophrys gambelii TaxID=257770 RepID=UPI0031407310
MAHGPSPACRPPPAAMRRGGPAAIAACLAGALAVLAGPGPGPGNATGTGRRPPRSYGHLEGDVRWRRLFSATRFFLRIDGGGGVEGTRWRERPGSIVEIRSVRVGVVAIRAVHTGFYLAMNKRGRLYGSVGRTLPPGRDCSRVTGSGQARNRLLLSFTCTHCSPSAPREEPRSCPAALLGCEGLQLSRATPPHPLPSPARRSSAPTASSRSALRRTATTRTRRCAGGTAAAPCSCRSTARAGHREGAGRAGSTSPHTSSPCSSAERRGQLQTVL